jgi:hypothetical protein
MMLSAYFILIYEEMRSMKNLSHGVISCICVETNVILKMDDTKSNID